MTTKRNASGLTFSEWARAARMTLSARIGLDVADLLVRAHDAWARGESPDAWARAVTAEVRPRCFVRGS